LENALDQRAEPWRAGEIRAVAGDIDAGEHQFAIAVRAEPPCLLHHLVQRDEARIAAPKRNDAERAAMVAAVLHLQKSARMAFYAVARMHRVAFHRHDVADGNPPAVSGP